MRVLLINPPSPESTGAPLLGQQYVAAALLEEGCEVRLIDAAARFFPHNAEWIAHHAHDFQPHVIGIGLFTRWVWHAYQLAAHLRHGPWILLAGGAHATVRPEETLRHGFHAALTGEAEVSIRHFVRVIATGGDLAQIPGIVFRQSDGATAYGPPAAFLDDLDSLAHPHKAQPLYAPHWYSESGATMTPGGILTSRGCPARCTFCANHVTGRRFRHRSPSNITAELNAWHAQTTHTFFPFWDDAFTANPSRLTALCEAFQRDLHFPLSFSAITRANMVTPDLLRTMRRAGLIHVNFGVESGDDNILRAIRKGIRTDHVIQSLEWAKEQDLVTACNFMLGFPQETEAELERTLHFMHRIAPLVDSFSTMGVLVPFPGTPLYDDYHFQYGFTDWWLRPHFSRYQPPPPVTDTANYHRYYIDDTNLELDFFRYTPGVRRMIRQCLRFKAEHNLHRMGLLPALGVA